MCIISSVLKFVLIGVNVVIVIGGIIIISLGAVVESKFGKFDEYVAGGFSTLGSLLMVFGILVCIVGIVGIIGACLESKLILRIQSLVLLILILILVIYGIVALIMAEALPGILDEPLTSHFEKYEEKGNLTNPKVNLYELIYAQYECCGYDGPKDFAKMSMPYACCGAEATSCSETDAFQTGCRTMFVDSVVAYTRTPGTLALLLAILLGAAFVLSCYWTCL